MHERMQPQTKSERGNIMAQRKQDTQSIEQLKQMVYTLQEHRGDLLETLLTFASS